MQIRTADGRFETRSANALSPWGSTSPVSNGQLGGSVAGVNINDKTALQLAAVYGSVALICDSIATLPIQQWRQAGDTAMQMPVAPVIERPWPEITQRDFIIQGTASLLLRGNLFGRVTAWNEKVYPAQVQLIHPDHATVKRDRHTGQIEVRYWNDLVPPDDVTRAMALQIPEGLVGLNPIEYMRNVLGVGRAMDLLAGARFANSSRPDVVISAPGDFDVNEMIASKNSWKEAFGGIGHAFEPAFVSGGATVTPITMTAVDAQFLEQMQLSESQISGRIYRVPPHMLGMVDKDTSWGAGIEQQELGFVRNTLLIWLERWQDLLSSWLPPRQFVTFDLSHRLRGDTLQRFSAWQIARVSGFMSNLDIIKAEGLTLPTDPALIAQLSDYAAPLNSAPVKPTSTGGAGGDKSD